MREPRASRNSPRRLDTAKRLLKDMGGEFKSFFLTMGEYDFIAVYDAPDDAIAARFTLQLGSLGNVRTKTLKAFPEAAYREIVTSLADSQERPTDRYVRVAHYSEGLRVPCPVRNRSHSSRHAVACDVGGEGPATFGLYSLRGISHTRDEEKGPGAASTHCRSEPPAFAEQQAGQR